MVTEYRVICTATFGAAVDRDAFYTALKSAMPAKSDTMKRADMTKDQYVIPDASDQALMANPVLPVSEQVI